MFCVSLCDSVCLYVFVCVSVCSCVLFVFVCVSVYLCVLFVFVCQCVFMCVFSIIGMGIWDVHVCYLLIYFSWQIRVDTFNLYEMIRFVSVNIHDLRGQDPLPQWEYSFKICGKICYLRGKARYLRGKTC